MREITGGTEDDDAERQIRLLLPGHVLSNLMVALQNPECIPTRLPS